MIEAVATKHKICMVENVTNDIFCVTSGILDNTETHTREIANLTLELMKNVNNLKMDESPGTKIQLRIGIHTGVNILIHSYTWLYLFGRMKTRKYIFHKCILPFAGACAAGIVGRKVPYYSVFGESVKMAYRMCRNGAGKLSWQENEFSV